MEGVIILLDISHHYVSLLILHSRIGQLLEWKPHSLHLTGYCFLFYYQKENNLYIASVFYILATLVRMEGILYFISIVMAYSINNYIVMKKIDKIFFRRLLELIIPYIIAMIIWELWRWNYYGSFLPNTYYIKIPAPDQNQFQEE